MERAKKARPIKAGSHYRYNQLNTERSLNSAVTWIPGNTKNSLIFVKLNKSVQLAITI